MGKHVFSEANGCADVLEETVSNTYLTRFHLNFTTYTFSVLYISSDSVVPILLAEFVRGHITSTVLGNHGLARLSFTAVETRGFI